MRHCRRYFRDRNRALAVASQFVGDVLFEHDVEVGAAKTKGTGAGSTNSVGRDCPRFQLGVDVKRGVSKVDVRVGMLATHAGRQYLVTKRQGSFQQPGGSSRTFEMSNVRFD